LWTLLTRRQHKCSACVLNHRAIEQATAAESGYNAAFRTTVIAMNDEFFKQQAARVRAIADRADPFTRKRLLDLAERYELKTGKPSRATRSLDRPTPLPTGMLNRQKQPEQP
jgi:nucleoside 2-deoxyribosyltransferase